ncbi:helix-turn-helix domain-containing protein [Parasalinivibrio latis]|uniref:DNA-3-methyladenine glycosylase 2 family protein n=1 Tax=Parasalinivibrio latis TaxID=2952610 RepID=UPI0030DEC2F7
MLDMTESWRRARESRDHRFDGKFFVGVVTTGIYCRPICPAKTASEENVRYFHSAVEAAGQGFRPCLRCRPDSAPGSNPWKGVDTTLERAVSLIDSGYLHQQSVTDLCHRLGVSDRYLRKLFHNRLGLSPKQYSLYQQVLFAKKLLHETRLPVSEIAFAAGFNSVRRFNDSFSSALKLTPSQVRGKTEVTAGPVSIRLAYRPPYDWDRWRVFVSARLIHGMEWLDEHTYGRTFAVEGAKGWFIARHQNSENCFDVEIHLNQPAALFRVVKRIRRILDLDADPQSIHSHLSLIQQLGERLIPGLRIPGAWSTYEAGIRAVLGQQVTVTAATNMVRKLVSEYGESEAERLWFPAPSALAASDIHCLKMPGGRKQALRDLARLCSTQEGSEPENWLSIKGIGRWTVDYARMRGSGEPDIFLAGDLGVVRKLEAMGINLDPDEGAPWRSYLTFQLWNLK